MTTFQALERCQLKDVVVSKPEKLDAPGITIFMLLCVIVYLLAFYSFLLLWLFIVADSGENWSVGQRQLLCLGRVILKLTQILFMDEATASVDSQTDGTIQKITRREFSSCTIISIAHRIPTVMDCDRVLVLDAGRSLQSVHSFSELFVAYRLWYLVKLVCVVLCSRMLF